MAVKVVNDKLLSASSCRDVGTLYQLKTLLRRSNVSDKVSTAFHADRDFFSLVTDGYVAVAAASVRNVTHLVLCNDSDNNSCTTIEQCIALSVKVNLKYL